MGVGEVGGRQAGVCGPLQAIGELGAGRGCPHLPVVVQVALSASPHISLCKSREDQVPL